MLNRAPNQEPAPPPPLPPLNPPNEPPLTGSLGAPVLRLPNDEPLACTVGVDTGAAAGVAGVLAGVSDATAVVPAGTPAVADGALSPEVPVPWLPDSGSEPVPTDVLENVESLPVAADGLAPG